MKQSRKAKEIAARKAADPIAQLLGRDDIDYTTDELPTAPRAYMVSREGAEALITRPSAQGASQERAIKFRTPTRCQNGHFRFLYYSIKFGKAIEQEWGPRVCTCLTGSIGEGFAPCGPEQQFTGLFDSKGVELFEGDIVDHLKYGSLHEVAWIAESAGFFLRKQRDGSTMALSSLCQENIEIVGHVYE